MWDRFSLGVESSRSAAGEEEEACPHPHSRVSKFGRYTACLPEAAETGVLHRRRSASSGCCPGELLSPPVVPKDDAEPELEEAWSHQLWR